MRKSPRRIKNSNNLDGKKRENHFETLNSCVSVSSQEPLTFPIWNKSLQIFMNIISSVIVHSLTDMPGDERKKCCIKAIPLLLIKACTILGFLSTEKKNCCDFSWVLVFSFGMRPHLKRTHHLLPNQCRKHIFSVRIRRASGNIFFLHLLSCSYQGFLLFFSLVCYFSVLVRWLFCCYS